LQSALIPFVTTQALPRTAGIKPSARINTARRNGAELKTSFTRGFSL